MIRVREAAPGDAASVVALARALGRDQGDSEDVLTAEAVMADLIGARRTTLLMVAEAPGGGALIGYTTAHPTYETAHAERGLYIGDLYVDPAHRRRGVARALMAHVAAAGRARFGARHLWWTARQDNAAAHAFYRRLGAHGEPVLAFACAEDSFRSLAAEARP